VCACVCASFSENSVRPRVMTRVSSRIRIIESSRWLNDRGDSVSGFSFIDNVKTYDLARNHVMHDARCTIFPSCKSQTQTVGLAFRVHTTYVHTFGSSYVISNRQYVTSSRYTSKMLR